VQVNLLGTVHLVTTVTSTMVERRRGDVVFVTSDAVRHPRPMMAAYSATKWALEGYARTLQMELEGTGVRASIVQPGPTRTEMGMDWGHDVTADVIEQWIRWGQARHDHFMDPESVAAAVVTAVAAPRGTNFTMIEVNPEAPVHKESP
jgi:NADP-dependent 3-hydroxy acid dehydrogenase YdfG